MNVMNSFIVSIFQHIISINSKTASKTTTCQEIQDICLGFFPDKLAKQAIIKGKEAIDKFNKSKTTKKSISLSERAGLIFPVGRINRYMKKGNIKQIDIDTPVYLAAIIEHVTTKLLEIAGDAAHDNKRKRIIPRHIQLAIRNDDDFNKLFGTIWVY